VGLDDGEFRGFTRAEIKNLSKALDALKDESQRAMGEVRSDLADISKVLGELRDFKTRVLAYAGLMAAGATFAIQFIMDRLN